MNRITIFAKQFLLLVLLISFGSAANAGEIVPCPTGGCIFSVSTTAGGNTISGGGFFDINPTTGNITLNTNPLTTEQTEILSDANLMAAQVSNGSLIWSMPTGNQISVNNVFGNGDPILGFGLGASTGGMGGTFSFSFDLPVSIGGLINARSEIGYTLTDTLGDGAEISGIGGDKILQAFEIDTDFAGLPDLNKGVDVGDDFSFITDVPATLQSMIFSETNQFTGSTDYDLMSVFIDFSLSKNSAVGISGFVEQTVVPVPAAVWLFGSALGMLGWYRNKATTEIA